MNLWAHTQTLSKLGTICLRLEQLEAAQRDYGTRRWRCCARDGCRWARRPVPRIRSMPTRPVRRATVDSRAFPEGLAAVVPSAPAGLDPSCFAGWPHRGPDGDRQGIRAANPEASLLALPLSHSRVLSVEMVGRR